MKTNSYLYYLLRFTVIIFLLCVHSAILQAQVEFTATTNTHTVGLQQSFNVTFTLKGGKGEAFERPGFDNFRVVGQSTRSGGGMTVIINNQVVSGGSDEQSWTFTLLPTTHGKFTIEPAKVRVDGKVYTTNSLEITVMNTGQAQQPTQQPQASGRPAQPQQRQTPQEQQSSNISDKDVFIRATANKSTAWIGEPVVITYKIYTRLQIPSYTINRIPSFIGFWSEDISGSERVQPQEEIIDGQKYTTAVIRRTVVFPQQSGKLTIEPLEVEAIVRLIRQAQRRSRTDEFDIFNQFFNDPFFNFPSFGSTFEDVRTTVKSNPVTINAKELPITKKPANYSGQVGTYTLEVWLDKERILLNDALNLTVKITGNGNMNLMDAPGIQFPKSFDVFDPEIQSNISRTASGISGSKTFNFLIIPREPGLFKIPSVEFSYFSISQRDYVTLFSDKFEVEVVGKDGIVSSRSAIGQIENDIRFIKIQPTAFRPLNKHFVFSNLFYALLLLPLFIFAALLILLRRNMKLQSNKQLLKYKRATNIAKKRLKQAAKLLKNNQIDEFYIETSKAIWEYVSDRFLIEQSELSIDRITAQLLVKGVDENLISELQQTLNFCEYIRYAPGSKHTNPASILKDAQHIITQLEQHINKKIK